MRTTIRLDDELMRAAKQRAVETGRTLTAVIEDALRQALAQREGSAGRSPRLPMSRSAGTLLPGIDLDDSAALLDLMESTDAPR
ncbi:MAG TPA: YlcI/YnfO family protein [Gaiellaceae bacterium]|jgi:hypothetical protein